MLAPAEAARLIGDRHRSIYFVGGRITGALAEYFFTHMQVIRPKTTLISTNTSSWPQHVLNMQDGDVLVIFDIRRYEADLTTLAEVARANALVQQYNAFSPIPGMNVNGELTLGENIGDLSGLAVARKAYQIALDGKTAPVLDGFTGEQRFYLGWGQVWARNYRDDELRKRLKTNPHSPSEYRANGILRNMPDFAKAFDVKEGDKMYLAPEQAVRIW